MLEFSFYVAMFYYIFIGLSFWLTWWAWFSTRAFPSSVRKYTCSAFLQEPPTTFQSTAVMKVLSAPPVHMHTYTHTAAFFFCVWSSLWCIVVFCSGGHVSVTLAKMKGLRCAPSKGCTYGPAAVGIQQTHTQVVWSRPRLKRAKGGN